MLADRRWKLRHIYIAALGGKAHGSLAYFESSERSREPAMEK
jgi:hypothetical protein